MKKYAGAVIDGPLMGQNIIKEHKTFKAVYVSRKEFLKSDIEELNPTRVVYEFDNKMQVWKVQK
jgi:hypothetical protein